jgi:hypothetical protein
MKYIVEPGREVGINGRRYLAGDELPELAGIAIESLVKSGVVKADRPEPVQQPAERSERRK